MSIKPKKNIKSSRDVDSIIRRRQNAHDDEASSGAPSILSGQSVVGWAILCSVVALAVGCALVLKYRNGLWQQLTKS